MSNPNHKAKRDYLVGKLIDGALALSELFYQNLTNPATDSKCLARSLNDKYDLTKNQRGKLRQISNKIERAKSIVGFLTSEYQLGQKGNFEKRQALYRLIYGKEPPKEFTIKPHSFTMGVYAQKECFKEDVMGDAGSLDVTINDVLRDNGEEIKKGTFRFRNLDNLVFRVNCDDPDFLAEYKEKGLGNTFVERHEIKHIIDILCWDYSDFSDELSADMFAGHWDRTSIYLGTMAVEAKVKKMKRDLERLKKEGCPEIAIKLKEDALSKVEKSFRDFLAISLDDLKEVSDNLDNTALSYVVGMIPSRELARKIKLIKEHLKK
ncbi:MAG: hypothetical protein AABW58_01955 [Nanoarchaeota archaeon]